MDGYIIMGKEPGMIEEQLLGFDIREARNGPDNLWDAERRALYLLRTGAAQPLSIDPLVWSSLFDTGQGIGFSRSERERLHLAGVPVPAYTGPITGVWEDAERMRQYLQEHRAGPQPCVMIAISQFAGSSFSGRPGFERSLARPSPALIAPDWERLGYDVGDDSLVSGLSNCGYLPEETQLLREQWGPLLNESHLFDDLETAFRFRSLADARVPSHAPFYVYGLYLIETLA